MSRLKAYFAGSCRIWSSDSSRSSRASRSSISDMAPYLLSNGWSIRYGGRMTEDHSSRDGFTLDGAVAIVTGATRGIGRATAEVLGGAGAHVVVVGRSTRERPHRFSPGTVDDVAAELGAAGIDVLGVPADLTDPARVATIVDRTLEWRGRCDVLVNNA